MSRSNSNVLDRVVKKGLCSGCGVCAGLCPQNALSMQILANGDLAPVLDATRCNDNCNLCLSVCPFTSGVFNPRAKNEELFKTQKGARFHEDAGWHLDCFVGYRKDPDLRKISASGGLLTWCLEDLLEQSLVDRIAVVRFAKNETGFFEFFAAESIEDLRKAAGSVYHPVSIDKIIKEIRNSPSKRWAIVGVPCLCAAIRNAQPYLQNKLVFLFGLACGMYQNTFYTELLLAASGIARDSVTHIEYRRKSLAGPANDYRFRGTDNQHAGKEIPYSGLPYFLGRNAFFRHNSCNFCVDVFAETADACFMDAWLPNFVSDPLGTNLVLVRNASVANLFTDVSVSQSITLSPVTTQDAVKSQQGHVKRKRQTITFRCGNERPNSFLSDRVYRLTWQIERYASFRSKQTWNSIARFSGIRFFRLATIDILALLQVRRMAEYYPRILLKLRRLLFESPK